VALWSRAWFERDLTLCPVTGDQAGYPALRHAVVARYLRLRTSFDDDGGD
jgi:hypothetical protein